ncbi:hypothetical protein BJ508DRAFT_414608 [Ascobolus immersus RN42]|uniref:Uncharacterized protein n=1 Tax=Ascobolus immersus RN42 TaxID=1160509 RepID=A0A3N4IBT2_ASCIM|nr:hypothetical protein BJ508DRAFT_414608 [Ascobolus immersus RN42]
MSPRRPTFEAPYGYDVYRNAPPQVHRLPDHVFPTADTESEDMFTAGRGRAPIPRPTTPGQEQARLRAPPPPLIQTRDRLPPTNYPPDRLRRVQSRDRLRRTRSQERIPHPNADRRIRKVREPGLVERVFPMVFLTIFLLGLAVLVVADSTPGSGSTSTTMKTLPAPSATMSPMLAAPHLRRDQNKARKTCDGAGVVKKRMRFSCCETGTCMLGVECGQRLIGQDASGLRRR